MADRRERRAPARTARLSALALANLVALAALVWLGVSLSLGAGSSAAAEAPSAPLASVAPIGPVATARGAARRVLPVRRAPVDQAPADREREARLTRDLRAIVARAVEDARVKSGNRAAPENVRVSVAVRERGAPVEVALDADRPQRPASNQKLVTTAAALILLGSDWTFVTPIEAAGDCAAGVLRGDLVVRASGDPLYDPAAEGHVEPRFDAAVAQLRAAGCRRVTGDLVLDEGAFRAASVPPAWPDAAQHWQEYCALSAGFSVNRGCVTIRVEPTQRGADARVSAAPRHHGLLPSFTVETRGRGNPTIAIGAVGERLVVRGSIPADSPVWSDSCAHPDPVELFSATLRAALERGGVDLEGEVVRERLRPGGPVLARLETPLLDYLVPINTDSTNAVADQVALAMAAVVEGAGTFEAAGRAARRALERLGVSGDGFSLADGSGLSRANRISARQLVALLAAVLDLEGRVSTAYLDSLAVAGESGTLDGRMRRGPARGRVFAKSGFIDGTSALSGLARTPGGREFLFSILVEYPTVAGLNSSVWKPMQDALCERLVAEDGP